MITNRDIRNWQPPYRPKPTRTRRRLILLSFWLLSTLIGYFLHPYIQTVTGWQRFAFATQTLSVAALWFMVESVYHAVLSGASRFTPAQFQQLFLSSSVALWLLPMLLYQFWLSRPANYRKASRFEQMRHRLTQNILEPAEVGELLPLAEDGLPLAEVKKKRNESQLVGIKATRSNNPDAASFIEGHAFVCGPTRSGKSMHLTETLLRYPHAALVVDPKSEQFERTAAYRQQHIGPVYRLPGHTLDLSDYYDLSNKDDNHELHQHILRPQDDHQPIFAEKAVTIFSAAYHYAKAHDLNPFRVLLDAASGDPKAALNAWLEIAPEEVLAFTMGDKPDKLDRFGKSAYGTLHTRMDSYQQHWQTITTSGTAMSIPLNWVDQKATIYLTYNFNQLDGVGELMAAIMAGLLRYQIKQDSQIPFLAAIDELPAVGLSNIVRYLSHIGGFGCTLLLYAQTYSQLIDRYGRNGAQTILSNCQYQIWHPPNDSETARQMSDLLGTRLHLQTSRNQSRRKERFEIDAGMKGISVGEQLHQKPMLSPSEIAALPQDKVLVRTPYGNSRIRFIANRIWPVAKLKTLPQMTVLETAMPENRPKPHWLSTPNPVTESNQSEVDDAPKPIQPAPRNKLAFPSNAVQMPLIPLPQRPFSG